jgi:probable HAF family extracellular repeat protein
MLAKPSQAKPSQAKPTKHKPVIRDALACPVSRLAAFALAGLSLGAGTALAGPKYLVTDLGTVPGGIHSIGLGINALGQVTGQIITGDITIDIFPTRAFIDPDGAGPQPMVDLGTLGGAYSNGFGINASGQVVGWSDTSSGTSHAFIDPDGAGPQPMVDLGTLGGNFCSSHGINDSGQVTGGSAIAGTPVSSHAFIDPDGAGPQPMVDLGTLGGSSGEGMDINASGQVAGVSYTTGNSTRHAFIDPDGAGPQPMVDLGTLGGANSRSTGINASGQVVGHSDTSSGTSHAFIDPDGAGPQPMVDLGTLGGTHSLGYGINASGQVTGHSYIAGDAMWHAFIDPDGAGPKPMQDLNDLILPNSGWILVGGYDINDTGQITGAGLINGLAQSHAFVLTPDTTAPQITCPAALNSNGQPALILATATDNLDPNPVITNDAPTSFPDGATTVTWTATDAAGNPASCTQTVTLDSTPPLISEILTPALPVSGWYNGDISLAWQVTDPESTVTTQVNCPDAASAILITADSAPSGTNYTCQATSAGGSATKTINVKRDSVAPVLVNMPADFSVPAVNPSGATVTYTPPTATDDNSGVASVNCIPASNSIFPMGATPVSCSASDNAGNTATGGFSVTVNSLVVNIPPVANGELYLFNPWKSPALAVTRNVTAPGVLGNDSDADGNALSAVLATPPLATLGSVVLNADGSFDFTPRSGITSASFTYQASDGLLSSTTATVNLRANTAPKGKEDKCLYRRVTGILRGAACMLVTANPLVIRVNLSANDTDANNITNRPIDGRGKTVDASSVQVTQVSAASTGSVVNNGDGTADVTIAPTFKGDFKYGSTIADDLGLRSAMVVNVVTVK